METSKIIVDYKDANTISDLLKIESAKYLSDYAIRVKFTDGVEKLVDFKCFLNQSQHPTIKKYLNESIFSKFTITNSNLNWNDYELIFPIEKIYKGEILP